MKKLEVMQKEFKEWLRKVEKNLVKKEIDLKDSIEKKLIEIAIENDYKLIDRNVQLG